MSCLPILSAHEVERGYDNRAAVPDHAAWFARWSSLSAVARETLHPRLDVAYGAGPRERLDLFLPPGRARGTLVFIHGGYWRAFDKRDNSYVAPAFVDEGIAVAVLNHELCPAVGIGTILDQCRAAVGHLAREGHQHGLDAGRIVVAGHSAGGQLAAMLRATETPAVAGAPPALLAAVSISGLHDLEPLLRFSLNADFRLDAAEARRLSPVRYVPSGPSPVLIAVGGEETSEYRRQARLLCAAWPAQTAGCAPDGIVVPGRHHFSVVTDLADPASTLTRAILALFA